MSTECTVPLLKVEAWSRSNYFLHCLCFWPHGKQKKHTDVKQYRFYQFVNFFLMTSISSQHGS